MWFSMMIAIGLVTLAVAGYFFVSRRDEPIETNRLYMMVYEDGLFEVFFGVLLIAVGFMLDVYAGMIGILFAILYPFLLAAKTFITKPRFDPTELPPEKAKRRQLSMFVVLGMALFAGLLTFLLIVANVGWARHWLDLYLLPTVVLVIAGLFALSAYRTDIQRLYLYAAFILLAYVASFWLTLPFPIYLIAIGIGVTVVGLFMMVRFIQAHPTLSESD
ncbi:hypothetical protein KFU94_25440 [Chloroflexi bacterium TSY]|nr:hypothetical protein [Chloroflexi bacterium TSY]